MPIPGTRRFAASLQGPIVRRAKATRAPESTM